MDSKKKRRKSTSREASLTEYPLRFELVAKAAKAPLHEGIAAGNDGALMLYALYMQATKGDCNMPRPSVWMVSEYAKWKCWTAIRGMGKMEAMHKYVMTCEEEKAEIWDWVAADMNRNTNDGPHPTPTLIPTPNVNPNANPNPDPSDEAEEDAAGNTEGAAGDRDTKEGGEGEIEYELNDNSCSSRKPGEKVNLTSKIGNPGDSVTAGDEAVPEEKGRGERDVSEDRVPEKEGVSKERVPKKVALNSMNASLVPPTPTTPNENKLGRFPGTSRKVGAILTLMQQAEANPEVLHHQNECTRKLLETMLHTKRELDRLESELEEGGLLEKKLSSHLTQLADNIDFDITSDIFSKSAITASKAKAGDLVTRGQKIFDDLEEQVESWRSAVQDELRASFEGGMLGDRGSFAFQALACLLPLKRKATDVVARWSKLDIKFGAILGEISGNEGDALGCSIS